MIVSEGKRLQAEGKNGLVILPGVQDLLAEVCIPDFWHPELAFRVHHSFPVFHV